MKYMNVNIGYINAGDMRYVNVRDIYATPHVLSYFWDCTPVCCYV